MPGNALIPRLLWRAVLTTYGNTNQGKFMSAAGSRL
jgi:hypothetical protein